MNLNKDILYEISLHCGYRRLRNLFFAFPNIKTIKKQLKKLNDERYLIGLIINTFPRYYICYEVNDSTFLDKLSQKIRLRKPYSRLLDSDKFIHNNVMDIYEYAQYGDMIWRREYIDVYLAKKERNKESIDACTMITFLRTDLNLFDRMIGIVDNIAEAYEFAENDDNQIIMDKLKPYLDKEN